MEYQEIKTLLQDSTFIYADVMDAEMSAFTVDMWKMQLSGVTYIGTAVEVEALAAKLVPEA